MSKKIIFLHHSTGANLLREGNIRSLLNAKLPDVELWDHGYSFGPFRSLQNISHLVAPYLFELSDNNGNATGKDYGLKMNNTNPDGYATIFSQPITNPATNEFSRIMLYDTVIFKSCYPVTKIISDQQLKQYQKYYLSVRQRIDTFPNKLFILFSPPPLRLSLTQKEFAQRARKFANWLKSTDYVEKRKNILVFDFFDFLAGKITNTLKPEYCRSIITDSHPNSKANIEIGTYFINFLTKEV